MKVMLCWLVVAASFQAVVSADTAQEGVRVVVVDSKNNHVVSNARVFVLSEDGKELAAATTDAQGTATLSGVDEAGRPKYVMVEHARAFLSGLLWQSGLAEYYILLVGLVIR
jgi:uncharacterized protein YfaS (alpha-2-macroglobulin family)